MRWKAFCVIATALYLVNAFSLFADRSSPSAWESANLVFDGLGCTALVSYSFRWVRATALFWRVFTIINGAWIVTVIIHTLGL